MNINSGLGNLLLVFALFGHQLWPQFRLTGLGGRTTVPPPCAYLM